MSLRFAIIKHVKTYMGDDWEDVVFEYQEDRVKQELSDNLSLFLPKKKWYQKTTEEELIRAFEAAWKKTVNDFKKVTVRIF